MEIPTSELSVNYERSETFTKIAMAMVSVQSQLEAAHKDATNPYFGSKYATLDSVWSVCRKPLTENGICVIQLPSSDVATVTVKTILIHAESGEWFSCALTMRPEKMNPQEIGKVITYGRRYTLAPMVGVVVEEDDDGNSASQPNTGKQYRVAAKSESRPTGDMPRKQAATPVPTAAPEAGAYKSERDKFAALWQRISMDMALTPEEKKSNLPLYLAGWHGTTVLPKDPALNIEAILSLDKEHLARTEETRQQFRETPGGLGKRLATPIEDEPAA